MISKRLRRWPGSLLLATLFLWCSPTTGGPRQISNDRDLKELDLTGWNCLNRPEGSARTPDGMERNRLKNRLPVDLSGLRLEDLNVQTFLNATARFDALTKNKRRKDLVSAERALLDPLEKQIVRMTGYLVLAYCGPPETTNCASVDFHDWHLEVFEKPSDHPPQPGDPTSIICEITPRTQNQLYREGIRIQALTAFFRGPDLTYQATGHKAARIRVTGYRLWDDEHNGRADVGPTVRSVGANKYHNPWRLSAWEIHPVIQIEALDLVPGEPAQSPGPTAAPRPSASSTPSASPQISSSPVPSATPEKQFVTVVQPVSIRIPYGQTILPPGTKLRVVSHDTQTVTIEYMGGTYAIPIGSTDY